MITLSRQRQNYLSRTDCSGLNGLFCLLLFPSGKNIFNRLPLSTMYQIPEEKCDLEPKRTCKHVTTLVPKLQPSEECVDVPKEVKGF